MAFLEQSKLAKVQSEQMLKSVQQQQTEDELK
jgi:hypothetical protein